MPITLPKEPTPKKNDLQNLTVLLHGGKKIGKSTFCSHLPNAVFAATEPGLGHLEVHQVPITSWQDFLDFCNALVNEKHNFTSVVIDTLNNLYAFCCRAVCEKHKVEYVGDFKAIGKGHVLANNMFYETMLKLANLPFGLWMVAHSTDREFETRTEKYIKTVPQLPDKAAGQILGMADMILYADLHEEKNENGKSTFRRVLYSKPSKYYEAGDRSGALPPVIDLNYEKFAAEYTAGIAAINAGSASPASGTGVQKTAASPDKTKPAAPAAAAKK